jgi:hypothetical protein
MSHSFTSETRSGMHETDVVIANSFLSNSFLSNSFLSNSFLSNSFPLV